MTRDRDKERELLERAGGTPEFNAEVLGRLDQYEAIHGGNTGWEQDVDNLLREITEECADISGWALGAAHQLEDAELHRLVVAMSLGAAAHREVNALREKLALK